VQPLKVAKVEHVKSSTNNKQRNKGLKALARDEFDKSEPSINTVVERQDSSIYTYRICKL